MGAGLELFARGQHPGLDVWGNQAEEYASIWETYPDHSQSRAVALKHGG